MNEKNLKKKEIEKIIMEFSTKFSLLKKKRDNIISYFLNELKKRKLDELRKLLEKL